MYFGNGDRIWGWMTTEYYINVDGKLKSEENNIFFRICVFNTLRAQTKMTTAEIRTVSFRRRNTWYSTSFNFIVVFECVVVVGRWWIFLCGCHSLLWMITGICSVSQKVSARLLFVIYYSDFVVFSCDFVTEFKWWGFGRMMIGGGKSKYERWRYGTGDSESPSISCIGFGLIKSDWKMKRGEIRNIWWVGNPEMTTFSLCRFVFCISLTL